MTANNFSEIMKEEANKLAGNTPPPQKKKPNKKTTKQNNPPPPKKKQTKNTCTANRRLRNSTTGR